MLTSLLRITNRVLIPALGLAIGALFTHTLRAAAGDAAEGWPAVVPGFVAPKPGEHPRLLFRKSDLPKLRQRAQTPEGKVVIERTKFLLDGADKLREGKPFTMLDAAAFGFLYQMTGDKNYAGLAKQSQDKFWTPVRRNFLAVNTKGGRAGKALQRMYARAVWLRRSHNRKL